MTVPDPVETAAWDLFRKITAATEAGEIPLRDASDPWELAAQRWRPTARSVPDVRADMLRPDLFGDLALGGLFNGDGDDLDLARRSVSIVKAGLVEADLYWASPELVALTEVAAQSMPDQSLHPCDVPSRCGLIVLGAPVVDPDEGDPVSMNAYSWMLWDDEFYSEIGVEGERPTLMTIVGYSWTGEAGLIALNADKWYMDSDHDDNSMRRRLACLFTLAAQERTVTVEEVLPDRAGRRRLARAGREVVPVKMVDLRRPKGQGGGSGSVDYTHRWMVSGHWRNQWMPSRKLHRLQWIHPYVKGPDDKPLVVKDTVKVIR